MPITPTRPRFELSELKPKPRWILEEIEDINSDALSARCGSCSASLSWAQWILMEGRCGTYHCHSCGAELIGNPDCGQITAEEASEVLSRNYLDRTWYHATKDENWLSSVQSAGSGDLLVHVGDRLSALARADFITRRGGQTVYLYSFRIYIPDSIAPAVAKDMGRGWQTRVAYPLPMERARILGEDLNEDYLTITDDAPLMVYHNRYEVPGSFSLLLAAALIEEDSVEVERKQHLPIALKAASA